MSVLWHDELLCNLVNGRMVGKHTKDKKIQMLNHLYVNNSYEALKRTTEDRNTWSKKK